LDAQTTFFQQRENILISKISIASIFCTNIITRTSRDINDAHNQKDKKKARKYRCHIDQPLATTGPKPPQMTTSILQNRFPKKHLEE
jgi:hypothetical protein